MTRTQEAISNVKAVIETARILVEQDGLLGLALLPLCHVGYVAAEDAGYAGDSRFERVVATRAQLPEGAIVIEELKDGQFLGDDHIVRNEGEDWIASVHTDEPHPTSWTGGWPVKWIWLKDSANLDRGQANERARKTLTGK